MQRHGLQLAAAPKMPHVGAREGEREGRQTHLMVPSTMLEDGTPSQEQRALLMVDSYLALPESSQQRRLGSNLARLPRKGIAGCRPRGNFESAQGRVESDGMGWDGMRKPREWSFGGWKGKREPMTNEVIDISRQPSCSGKPLVWCLGILGGRDGMLLHRQRRAGGGDKTKGGINGLPVDHDREQRQAASSKQQDSRTG